MDEIMDTKVVQMKFDNSQFRSGVEDTIKQLANLENSLEMQGASKGLDNVAKASKETSKAINVVGESVESVHLAFSYLEVAGITAMVKLTNAALSYGKKIADNLWSRSIGQIISGGKRRSQNISNAKFQLEGLGVAWDDIVDDINYGVKDTAYGLDEAATAASQLVASQVQLGEEMKTALRGISGTAAMTNSSFSEISNIWTTVASNGKLMTMQLRQLSARGLNASAVLAKAMGTTEAAINDMVTKGQIDFKTFAEAMDNAFGEHAKEANKTFQGALSNMNAALSRIGQKFADPVFENLRKVFIALTDDIDAVNKALQPAMDAFSTILGDAERVTEAFLTNEHFVKGLIALAVDFWTWVRTIISAIQEFSGVGIYIDNVTIPFENLAKSMQLYGDKAEYVKNIIKDVLAVGDIAIHGIKSALTILRPLGEAVLEGIGIPIQKIKEDFEPGLLYSWRNGIKAVMDVIAKFIAMKLADVIHAVAQAIRAINWKTVLQAIVIIVNAVSKAILLLPQLIRIVNTIFKAVVVAISVAIAAVSLFISKVEDGFNALKYIFGSKLNALFGGILPTVSISADTSAADDAAQQSSQAFDAVADSADNATESVERLNDTIDETSDRVEISGKNAAGAGRAIAKSYDDAANAATKAADKVEDASHRMTVASKGGPTPPGRNIPDRPEQNPEDDKSQGNRIDEIGKSKIKGLESSKNAWQERVASVFESLKSDKKVPSVAASAMEIWFGGIFNTIRESTSNWVPQLVLFMQTIIPIILGIVLVATKIKLAVTAFKIIFGVVNSVLGILKGIAEAFLSIKYAAKAMYKNAVANELRAVAELIRSLVGPIIAITAGMAVFVAAAWVIKKYDLQPVVEMLYQYLKSIIILIGILMAIGAVIKKYSTIQKVFTRMLQISATISNIFHSPKAPFKAKNSATDVIKALAAMFFALAVDLAVLAVAIKIVGEMDYRDLAKGITALGVITIILGALIFAVGNFANAFRTYAYTYEDLNVALTKKGPFSRDRGSERKNNEMYKTLIALAGTIAAITAAVVILGNQPIDVLAKGALFVALSMGALIGLLSAIIYISKSKDLSTFNSTKDGDFIKELKRGPAESSSLNAVIKIISALGFYMMTIAGVIRASQNVSPAQMGTLTGIIAVSMGSLIGLMAVIAWNARQATEVPSKQIKSVYSGMALAIAAVSAFMLSISASLMMLNGLDMASMWISFGVLALSLALLGGFMGLMSMWLKKASMTSELVVLAGAIMSMSIGLSIILLAVAGMFSIMQSIDWSAMEGSARYLIGVGIFVVAMTSLVAVLASVASSGPIIAASIGIFGGLSLLMFAISKLFETMAAVDWSALDNAKSILLGLGIFATLIMAFAVILGATGPVGLIAIAAIGVLSALFLSLSALFISIGQCVNLFGSGIEKIVNAIDTLIKAPWERAGVAVDGITDLIEAFTSMASSMDVKLLSGAIIFSGFVMLMSVALRMLTGIDQKAVKTAGNVLNQFFHSMGENLEEKQAVVNFLVGLAAMLPLIAQSIAASIIILAIGGIGLLAFAFEMIIFAALMQQVGDQIPTAMQTFVNALVECGNIIFEQGLNLLAGFAAIFSVAALSVVIGTLLVAGGGLMAAGAGLLYLAGISLDVGVKAVVGAISNAGKLMLKNIGSLITGVHALTALSIAMSVVGAALIVGGGLFAAGAGLMALGAVLFSKAVNSFGTSAVKIGVYANMAVAQFRMMVSGLYSLAKEAQGLGPAFAQAAVYTVAGFVQGIAEGLPVVGTAMQELGACALVAFLNALGIHSPATEMIKAAFWTVEGFVEGLVENAPSIQEVCTDIVGGVISIFSSGAEGVADEGANAGVGFLSNITDVFSIAAPDVTEMLSDIGIAWGDGLGNGMEEGFKRHIQNLINYENELASHLGPANWTQAEYSAYLEEAQRSGLNSIATQQIISRNNANAENRARNEGLIGQIPTYTPLSTLGIDTDYIDVDEIYRSLGGGGGGGSGFDTTAAMASAISGSSGAGSGINDQSKAASIGGGVGNTITNSNNTYNFYQTNYSPEPLDRSAIYQQTRNQFNSFYAYAKEKNLSY